MGVQADKQDEREQRLFDLGPSTDGRAPDSERRARSHEWLGPAMRRHPSVVLAPVFGLLILALGTGLVRTPTYTASTRLAVGGLNATNPASLTGFADAAQQLAQTYSRSVQGDGVVGDVAQKTDTSPRQVRSHLSAAPIPETPVFALTATSASSDGAIQLSALASQALVSEVDRASHADPTRLLGEYQTAELERQQVSSHVNALAASGGAGLATARSQLLAAEARATSLRNAYEASETSGTVPLEIIQKADRANSDRSSVLQLRAFIAIVVGLVLGMALAVFRDSPFYETTIAAIGSLRRRSPLTGARGGTKAAPGSRSSRPQRADVPRRPSRRART
jgi:capsular polysaccharide biosynthesis protein